MRPDNALHRAAERRALNSNAHGDRVMSTYEITHHYPSGTVRTRKTTSNINNARYAWDWALMDLWSNDKDGSYVTLRVNGEERRRETR